MTKLAKYSMKDFEALGWIQTDVLQWTKPSIGILERDREVGAWFFTNMKGKRKKLADNLSGAIDKLIQKEAKRNEKQN
jgi:hypothetical protein